MTDHLKLIRIKLEHLARMREYLTYSLSQVESVLLLKDWKALSPDQHESLAAFRVRFSEFQERHLTQTRRPKQRTPSMNIPKPRDALITGVTGQNTDHVKVRARTPLTSGVRLAYEHFLSAGKC